MRNEGEREAEGGWRVKRVEGGKGGKRIETAGW